MVSVEYLDGSRVWLLGPTMRRSNTLFRFRCAQYSAGFAGVVVATPFNTSAGQTLCVVLAGHYGRGIAIRGVLDASDETRRP